MLVSRRNSCALVLAGGIFLIGAAGNVARAQAPAGRRELTVDRIYSQPSLSGRMTRGLTWAPDGKQLTYLDTTGTGKQARTELWSMDATTGERKVVVTAEKLEDLTPAEPSRQTQATGLGRRAPAQYQWAPDGSATLWQVSTTLVWLDMKTQTARTLVTGRAALADAKISPNGRMVSFVRDHNLWVVNVADGKEQPITQGGTEEVRKGELDWVYPEELSAKTAYWWAPDSSSIAYMEMDEQKVSQYPMVDFASPQGEDELERYPTAGGANPLVRVLVASVAGGEARLIDTGAETDIYLPRVNWLVDSKQIAIQRLNRAQTTLDLLIADASTGKSKVVMSESDANWINISDDLHFLKDGKRFLWTSERSGFRHLYVYSIDGKELGQITKGDWEVTAVDGVDEAKSLVYFSATEKSVLERHFYRVGLDGSGFTRLTHEDGTHAAVIAAGGGNYYDSFSNSSAPPRQDLYKADGTRVAIINENKVPELAEYGLSPVEFLTLKAKDGAELDASVIKPPDFDAHKKYPVLVYTYGGPGVQVIRNAWGGATFLWHQLMAQKGYIIFSLDNRGSTARGHAFEAPIHLRMGAHELSDQLDGVQYLKSLPYVDANRIGVWGWSYGGHMTLHAMFEGGDNFKVGFAGGPVTDWRYYDSIYTERYLGLPQQNETGYKDSSPVKYASQLKGKLMIAHGTGDDNVHYANTLALINALVDAGKYVEVLAFPGRGHGVSDPAARKVLMRRVTQFFFDNL
jgi:dipeptidyl-peptidase 4